MMARAQYSGNAGQLQQLLQASGYVAPVIAHQMSRKRTELLLHDSVTLRDAIILQYPRICS